MITDSNGMPVLQPLVDDASTATFNTAFSVIGAAVNRRRYFTGTSTARGAHVTSGSAQTGDYWQDTNGDKFGYVYDGSWKGVTGYVDGVMTFAALDGASASYVRRYAEGTVEGYYKGTYDSAIADGSQIGTLPSGFRPTETIPVPASMLQGGGATACMVTIGSNGIILVYGISGTGNRQIGFNFTFKRG